MIKAVIFDMYETLITHYKSSLYFSPEMAEDAGIPVERFLPLWRGTESDRWVGKMTFEDTITMIMEKNHCYSEKNLKKITEKRIATKEEGFRQLHEEIIPMLRKLKEKGVKVGLISNCFSEEVTVIRKSVLFPYFDQVYLSYEQGVQKPDPEIYRRCMRDFHVNPEECLYVGDGGSRELEAAKALGMKPLQAVWYFQEGLEYQSKRDSRFEQLERPLEVLAYIDKRGASRNEAGNH